MLEIQHPTLIVPTAWTGTSLEPRSSLVEGNDRGAGRRKPFPVDHVSAPTVSRADLTTLLRDRIGSEGPIPFSTFMEAALYNPEAGYYAQRSFTTGQRGDFATAPDVGPLLGATLARPIQRFAEEGGRLVEIGPGSGRLLLDIVAALPDAELDALEIVLVEPFEKRRDQLVERFEADGVQPRAVASVADLDPARSFVLANELLDALPCEVARRGEDGIEQLTVDVDEDGFVEAWRPAPDELADLVDQRAPRLPVGHRYEIAPGLEALLSDVADAIDPGVAVFFDYGDRFEEVWPDRADGTLRGFREHQHVDPLTRPGETDITYDVDFSRVSDLAEEEGLPLQAFGPQERLLVHLGLMEVARDRGDFLSAKQLLVPGAFAGRFMALVLGTQRVAETTRLKVDLDDPGLWDRGLTEPLGSLEGDLGTALEEELDAAWDPPPGREP